MAKTLDDLQDLLARHGYTCERMVDVIVATTVATTVYKNPEGANNLEILLTFDRPNNCVAVEVHRAFELRDAAHKEATLACLLTATGRTPLLRPSLEPEGTVRLRIDCTLGKNGARVGDVLRAMKLLPSFVDAWYPQVTSAMQVGKFDANQVAHLNLSRTIPRAKPAGPATDGADRPGPKVGDMLRAAAISIKPGGHVNRLRVLNDFRRWLDEQRGGQPGGDGEQN
jgi:hypothetical protein